MESIDPKHLMSENTFRQGASRVIFPQPPVVLLPLWFGAGPRGGVCGLWLTGSLNPWCLWGVVC